MFLFHYVFKDFSPAFSTESCSSALSFCLTFSAFLNLDGIVICYSHEGVFSRGSILTQTVCASAVAERAEFDVDVSRVFL